MILARVIVAASELPDCQMPLVEDKYPEPGNEHVLRPAIDDITDVGRTGVRRPQWSSRIAFVQGEASDKLSRSTVTAAFFSGTGARVLRTIADSQHLTSGRSQARPGIDRCIRPYPRLSY